VDDQVQFHVLSTPGWRVLDARGLAAIRLMLINEHLVVQDLGLGQLISP